MSTWKNMLDKLDRESQLPAVTSPCSAVVSAGAGSGKTQVLAMRYLYLIKEKKISPEKILCLTFTNKAAAEMNERIRAMLAACAADDEDFAAALQSFKASRVSTLDAFCAEVARSAAPSYGLAPDFSVDSAQDSALKLAVRFLLQRGNEKAVEAFVCAAGFEAACEALAGLTECPCALIAARETLDYNTQRAAVAKFLDTSHGALIKLLHDGLVCEAGSAQGGRNWLSAADEFCKHGEKRAESYASLCALRKPTGKSPADEYFNAHADKIKALASAASSAMEFLSDKLQAEAVYMLNRFIDEARNERMASGNITFADVASIALAALETDASLGAWYKSRFDAVMIDEFQDDNETQKRIVFAVTKQIDTGLFFVGDEKQSIYAFRGADVSVFRGLSHELQSAAHAFNLKKNYRSEPQLIRFYNSLFADLMPPPDDTSAPAYAARFVPLEAAQPTKGVQPCVTWMELMPHDNDDFSSEELEAWSIAETIRKLVSESVPVAVKKISGGKEARPCRYEDIAVLFRSAASQNTLERYLRLFDIPYTATATAGLYSESILGDMYCMMRLLVYPNDRLALAAALRGPFAALRDSTVFTLMNGAQSLSELDDKLVPADEAAKRSAFFETLSALRAMSGKKTLAEMVSYLWYERGLRWNVLKDISYVSFMEHFDYTWALASAADKAGLSIVDFVNELEAKMGNVEKFEESVVRESGEGVMLMTVHASKGLEFPVVIIPDIDAVGRRNNFERIQTKGKFAPSLALFAENGDVKNIARDLEKANNALRVIDEDTSETLEELKRLFYVACTRAGSQLYLFGQVPVSADFRGHSFRGLSLRVWPWLAPANSKEAACFDEELRDKELAALRAAGIPFHAEAIPLRTRADYYAICGTKKQDAAERARSSARADTVQTPRCKSAWAVTSAAQRMYTFAPAGERSGAAPGALAETDFGTLCHRYVQAKICGKEPVLDKNLSSALDAVNFECRQSALGAASNFADMFVKSERGKAALSSSHFETEYPFVWRAHGRNGDIFLSGSMDLVYEDISGVVVVDFKTDVHEIPEHHAFQLAVYKDAAEAMFGKPAKAFVYFLRSGREVEVMDKPDTDKLALLEDADE